MQLAAIYFLRDNDKKKSALHLFSTNAISFFLQNIFNPRLVRSAGAEPADAEAEATVFKHCNEQQSPSRTTGFMNSLQSN